MKEFFQDPELQKFMLVFARFSGLLIFVPLFNNRRLAMQLKGGLIFFLTLAVFPSVQDAKIVLPFTFPGMGIAMIFEVLIGLIIGFCVQLIFTGFQIAGELIDRNIGFAMASLVDPQTDLNVSILATLMMNMGLYIFLEYDGHLWVVETFSGSFLTLPLMGTDFHVQGLTYHVSELFLRSFVFALRLSLPIIALVSLIYIALGFVQRTVPALNIFLIGFIFTITVGLISVKIMFQKIAVVGAEYIDGFEQEIWFIISNLNNG